MIRPGIVICMFWKHDWSTFEIRDTTLCEHEHRVVCLRCGAETTREELQFEKNVQDFANDPNFGM